VTEAVEVPEVKDETLLPDFALQTPTIEPNYESMDNVTLLQTLCLDNSNSEKAPLLPDFS